MVKGELETSNMYFNLNLVATVSIHNQLEQIILTHGKNAPVRQDLVDKALIAKVAKLRSALVHAPVIKPIIKLKNTKFI